MLFTKSLQDPPEQYSMMIHKPVPLRYDPWYLSFKERSQNQAVKFRFLAYIGENDFTW